MRATLAALALAIATAFLSAQEAPKPVTVTGELSVVFWVDDLDAAVTFWGKVLGAEPVYLLKQVGFGELRTPLSGVRIGLARGRRPGSGVVPTFGVADLDVTLASLKALEVEPIRAVTEMPGLCRLAAIADPAGNEVQFVQSLRAPASLWAKVSFLAGRWRTVNGDKVHEEVWTPPHGNAMFGQNRNLNGNKLTFFELLRIERRGDEFVYVAMPAARSVTAFRLTASGPRSATFTNPEHDFPKRIRYRIDPDGSLRATIDDGTADGQRQEFHWQPVR